MKQRIIKIPSRCPNNCTYETCNVDCPEYKWDQKTKPDSIKRSDLLDSLPLREKTERNLLASCYCCNSYKASFFIDEFRNEIKQQVERARKYSLNFRLAETFGLVQETGKEPIFYFETLNIKEPIKNYRQMIEECREANL